jgi:hypothetical protein
VLHESGGTASCRAATGSTSALGGAAVLGQDFDDRFGSEADALA